MVKSIVKKNIFCINISSKSIPSMLLEQAGWTSMLNQLSEGHEELLCALSSVLLQMGHNLLSEHHALWRKAWNESMRL